MRWIVATLAVLFIGWALFLASPFVSLYRLAKAVEARDVAAIEQRADMPEIRANFARQIIDEYLKSIGRNTVGGVDRQIAAQAGATLADPLVAQLVTPEALIDLLDDGWPQRMIPADAAPKTPVSFGLGSLTRAWRLFVMSETRGFRKVYIVLPHNRPPAERFRLLLRLTDTSWRVTGIDLPHHLLESLVKKLPRNAATALH